MKTTIKQTFYLLVIWASAIGLQAQSSGDSLIFKAMEDEMDRSMKNLVHKDLEKPCFLSYTLHEIYSLSMVSSMGSIVSFDTARYNSYSSRMLIGSYELNDENFRNDSYSAYYEDYGNWANSQLPMEPDYYAIRRVLWNTTNSLYMRAANLYKEKIRLFNEGKISKEDYKLADFAVAEPVTLMIEPKNFTFDPDSLKEYVRELSGLYKSYPLVNNIEVSLYYSEQVNYYTNTEGTRFRRPEYSCSLSIVLETDHTDFEKGYNFLKYNSATPDELPQTQTITAEIDSLYAFIVDEQAAESLEDEYVGPVLYLGRVAASELCGNLFGTQKSLAAERPVLLLDYENSVYFEKPANKWMSKWEERILPEGVSVRVLPKITSYKGIQMLENIPVDSEGVIPPDSIQLVQNGLLVGMLSSRTPTALTSASNGHRKYASYSYSNGLEPSVLHIQTDSLLPLGTLKQQLIEFAEDEGLEYAVIIRSIPTQFGETDIGYYKVDLETGKETLVSGASSYEELKFSQMKKLRMGGDELVIGSLSTSTGNTCSYIGPSALLVEEKNVSFITDVDRIHEQSDFITNPLLTEEGKE